MSGEEVAPALEAGGLTVIFTRDIAPPLGPNFCGGVVPCGFLLAAACAFGSSPAGVAKGRLRKSRTCATMLSSDLAVLAVDL